LSVQRGLPIRWMRSGAISMENESLMMLGILIGFPLAVGFGFFLIIVIQRFACTTSCPTCGSRIPKSAVTEHGVECDESIRLNQFASASIWKSA
jgi:hypothetical protein